MAQRTKPTEEQARKRYATIPAADATFAILFEAVSGAVLDHGALPPCLAGGARLAPAPHFIVRHREWQKSPHTLISTSTHSSPQRRKSFVVEDADHANHVVAFALAVDHQHVIIVDVELEMHTGIKRLLQ